jgi:beta-N-acetylhexosaminidase
MPGHGRARADSHHEPPRVDASREELKRDFAPFAALRDLPMAMSAHVVFGAIDPGRPATTSRMVVEDVMRREIGFDGLIMSDDVSMKALGGSYQERASAIFGAGLDIVLHCNGELEEARAVASATPKLSGESLRRADAALAAIAPPKPFDAGKAEAEFAALNSALAAA